MVGLVYFSETSDRKQFVAKVFALFAERLQGVRRVFVKPNIVSYESYPTTTHPDVLEAVLSGLSGVEIVVGDAPAIDAGRSNRILLKSPLRKVCDDFGVKLVNLYSEEMKVFKGPRGYKVRASALPLAFDLVVSLPVLKIHGMVGLSGALKNQFGYLSRRDRYLMHCKIKDIYKGIAEVNAAVHTDLFIMDAVETMIKAQECRHGGCPSRLNVIMAGADPVSLDCFGLRLLEKLEPNFERKNRQALSYIRYASEYGLGSEGFEAKRV
jgi:uncharacterized protein (DUF362 family)